MCHNQIKAKGSKLTAFPCASTRTLCLCSSVKVDLSCYLVKVYMWIPYKVLKCVTWLLALFLVCGPRDNSICLHWRCLRFNLFHVFIFELSSYMLLWFRSKTNCVSPVVLHCLFVGSNCIVTYIICGNLWVGAGMFLNFIVFRWSWSNSIMVRIFCLYSCFWASRVPLFFVFVSVSVVE